MFDIYIRVSKPLQTAALSIKFAAVPLFLAAERLSPPAFALAPWAP